MNTNKSRKPRPYWHVDAKWITGILLIFLLNITFVVFILVQITAPEPGIALLTMTLASAYSFESGGLDAPDDIEVMRQKIAESPNGEWQPIPGMRIVVREEDIAGKTPREVRLWFFQQWAEPLYYEGEHGLTNLITDPKMQKGVEGGVGPLGFISAATHRMLLRVLIAFGLVSFFFLGWLVFFSYRFGRLSSPGCVIFLAAIPGLILMAGVRGWLGQAQNPSAADELPALARYTQLAADVLPGIVQTALLIYVCLIVLGVGLMFIALVGTVFVRERKGTD
jgi:hypothetical protein